MNIEWHWQSPEKSQILACQKNISGKMIAKIWQKPRLVRREKAQNLSKFVRNNKTKRGTVSFLKNKYDKRRTPLMKDKDVYDCLVAIAEEPLSLPP